MRRFACPLRCRMRDGGSNCRSEPERVQWLSTMRGGGRRGAIREDAATFSRLASSFRSRRRRSGADDSSRDIYRHVVDGFGIIFDASVSDKTEF